LIWKSLRHSSADAKDEYQGLPSSPNSHCDIASVLASLFTPEERWELGSAVG